MFQYFVRKLIGWILRNLTNQAKAKVQISLSCGLLRKQQAATRNNKLPPSLTSPAQGTYIDSNTARLLTSQKLAHFLSTRYGKYLSCKNKDLVAVTHLIVDEWMPDVPLILIQLKLQNMLVEHCSRRWSIVTSPFVCSNYAVNVLRIAFH